MMKPLHCGLLLQHLNIRYLILNTKILNFQFLQVKSLYFKVVSEISNHLWFLNLLKHILKNVSHTNYYEPELINLFLTNFKIFS